MFDDPVLWLTRWAPYAPLRGGDMDYSRGLLESLGAITAVHALAFALPDVTPPTAAGISWSFVPSKPPHRLLSLASPLPNVAFRHQDAAYLDAAVQAGKSASAVIVDFIGLFGIVKPLMARLHAMGCNPPVILVDHNHEHAVRVQMVEAEPKPVMKAALALDTFKAGVLERAALCAANGTVANTGADAGALGQISNRPVCVIPPGYNGPKVAARVVDASVPRRLVVLGGHEAHHKRMVLERALTALDHFGVQSRAIVDVVGPGDAGELERRFQGFNFLGYVDDLSAYLDTVRIGLIPDVIGGGFKHRALTHAFMRTPMLAVDQALNGMGFTSGTDYVGYETLEQAAGAALPLMDDFDHLNVMQNAAFITCAGAYVWAERGATLRDFIQQLRDEGGIRQQSNA